MSASGYAAIIVNGSAFTTRKDYSTAYGDVEGAMYLRSTNDETYDRSIYFVNLSTKEKARELQLLNASVLYRRNGRNKTDLPVDTRQAGFIAIMEVR